MRPGPVRAPRSVAGAPAPAAATARGHRGRRKPAVALDELLGILLEDVVDLVEELIDVFLDLLALLGQFRVAGCAVAALGRLGGLRLFLLLLLCHKTLRQSGDPSLAQPHPKLILTDGHLAKRVFRPGGTACSASGSD